MTCECNNLRNQLGYVQILMQNMETRLKACEISLEMHAREIEAKNKRIAELGSILPPSYHTSMDVMDRMLPPIYQNCKGLEGGPPTIL